MFECIYSYLININSRASFINVGKTKNFIVPINKFTKNYSKFTNMNIALEKKTEYSIRHNTCSKKKHYNNFIASIKYIIKNIEQKKINVIS